MVIKKSRLSIHESPRAQPGYTLPFRILPLSKPQEKCLESQSPWNSLQSRTPQKSRKFEFCFTTTVPHGFPPGLYAITMAPRLINFKGFQNTTAPLTRTRPGSHSHISPLFLFSPWNEPIITLDTPFFLTAYFFVLMSIVLVTVLLASCIHSARTPKQPTASDEPSVTGVDWPLREDWQLEEGKAKPATTKPAKKGRNGKKGKLSIKVLGPCSLGPMDQNQPSRPQRPESWDRIDPSLATPTAEAIELATLRGSGMAVPDWNPALLTTRQPHSETGDDRGSVRPSSRDGRRSGFGMDRTTAAGLEEPAAAYMPWRNRSGEVYRPALDRVLRGSFGSEESGVLGSSMGRESWVGSGVEKRRAVDIRRAGRVWI
jgi:hypothetical protein